MTTPITQPTTDEASDLDFYRKALERVAAELGIVHPVQLMAESVKGETYADVLVKILRNQLAKLREENEGLRSRVANLESIVWFMNEHGDFRNGVTHDGIDEGAVMIKRMVQQTLNQKAE